jgi:hypothetical protein
VQAETVYRALPKITRQLALPAILVITGGVGASSLHAQALGFNLRGDAGLRSGSQPGPGYYFTIPIYYRSHYDSLRGPNGGVVADGIESDVNLLAPAVAATTKIKILGGNYGFQIVPPFMNQRLAVAAIDAEGTTGYAFSDVYVQPFNLGWHLKGADFIVGYGFLAPTGSGRRSLDMWGHEIVAGSTIYPTQSKNLHIATTVFYDIHQKKQGIDLTVGDYLTLEGGVGFSFLKGAASAGAAYVVQMKTTDDSGADQGPLAIGTRNKAYGVGPELSIPIFAKGKTLGLIGVRYIFEIGNKTNFQGDNLAVSFTVARLN